MKTYVAIVSSDEEFESILDFAKKNSDAKVRCVCQEYFPKNEAKERVGNIELSGERSWLSKREKEMIVEKALFFMRNWYKCDKKFEQLIRKRGINLGFVSEQAFFNFFKLTMLLLKAVSKAVLQEKPAAIVAAKGTFSATYCRIISKHFKIKSVELENTPLKKERSGLGKKFLEAAQQAAEMLNEKFEAVRTPNAAAVFVKHNGYLGSLPEEMRKDKELRVILLDKIVLRKFLNPVNLWRYLKTKAEQRLFFRKIFSDYVAKPAFRRQMVFEGMNLCIAFEKLVPRFAERDWPNLVFVIDLMLEEFEKKKPKALVLWVDFVPFERICTLIAKKFGVKSLVVQHGVFEITVKGNWIRGFVPLIADKIAVWGPHFKKLAVEHGVPASRVVVTGPPANDALKKRSFNPALFKKQRGIAENEKLVVLASTPGLAQSETKEILKGVSAAAGKNRLLIKMHPLEKKDRYEDLTGRAIVVQKTDLYELLNASDVLITKHSTVGLEAAPFGKPVIVFGKIDPENPYRFTDAFLKIRSASELAKVLNKIFAGDTKELKKRMKSFVYENAFRQDGRATGRIIKLVKKMAL